MELEKKNEKTEFIIGENQQNIKLKLFNKIDPFLYIQNDLVSKRYRIATNYKFLNNFYELMIDLKRNVKIKDQRKLKNFLNSSELYIKEELELNYTDSSIYITKYYNKEETHCIIIVIKDFEKESNISIFQASKNFFKLEDFLERINNEVNS